MTLKLFAIIAICLTAAILSGVSSGFIAIPMAICMLIGWRCEKNHKTYQKLYVILAVLFFLFAEIIDIFQHVGFGMFVRNIFLNTIWALLAYRALHHSKTMDGVQAGVLAVIPLACVAFAWPALGFLAFLIAYITCLLVFWASLSLNAPTSGSIAYASCGKTNPASLKKKFPLVVASALFSVFAIGIILFLFLPRYNSNTISGNTLQNQGSGAFPDVALDKTGKIDLDPTLVFRANLPPSDEPRYWRIEVQNIFDGSKWVSYSRFRRNREIQDNTTTFYKVEFVRPWRDVRIPTLPNTNQVRNLTGDNDSRATFIPDAFNVWRRRSFASLPMGFEFALQNTPTQERNTFHARDIWPNRTPHSSSYQRLHELAVDIVGNAHSNREKATKIRDYLQSHYAYSLERPPREGSTVEDFLFRQTFGHCEIFSTTMAVLLSVINVPVRNVSGFVSSEYRDGLHLVRAAHAHSWVEVYLDDDGWVVFDPTPSGAQSVEIDLLVRINDWFVTYNAAKLYQGIKTHALSLSFLFLFVIVLSVTGRIAFRFVKRRMLPPNEARRIAWKTFISACLRSSHSAFLAHRSYETWYAQNANDPITVFVKNNLSGRFERPEETGNTRKIFVINHRTYRALHRALRALKEKNHEY